MAALLLITADAGSETELTKLSNELNLRVRTVSSIQIAKEWLAMQGFDILLIDASYPESELIEVLSVAWKHNPLMFGALFSLYENPKPLWSATLQGARTFHGDKALDQIKDVLSKLPSKISLSSKETSILLVEDLDSPRDIISAYIENLGYPKVVGVDSAEAAIRKLETDIDKFFCVISDINMPKVSGIDFIHYVRGHKAYLHLPIVVLTAHPTVSNLTECIEAGATGFLAKPPKKKQLRQEIEKCRRIMYTGVTPRLCEPEEAEKMKDALRKLGVDDS